MEIPVVPNRLKEKVSGSELAYLALIRAHVVVIFECMLKTGGAILAFSATNPCCPEPS